MVLILHNYHSSLKEIFYLSIFYIIEINIYCQPIAQFSFQNVCLDSTILFEDQSIYQDSDSAWLWVFGDGNTSILQNPEHTYTSCDTFNVSLTVTDNRGCQNTFDTTVVVYCPPIINVFAAGNDGYDQPSIEAGAMIYDTDFQNTQIAVVAVGSGGKIASYSNKCGLAADYCIAAPGSSINAPGSFWTYTYTSKSGTSMAAPHVTGLLALVKESEGKKVIIATYAMAEEALDIKTLSTLIIDAVFILVTTNVEFWWQSPERRPSQ